VTKAALPDLTKLSNDGLVRWYDGFVRPRGERVEHAMAAWAKDSSLENARTLDHAEDGYAEAHRHWWEEFSRRREEQGR
jgi:hypothetical protein